jgi:hypothetical protein
MPKEYTHWVLAEKIFLELPDSRLKSLITGNKHLYYLGAVIPDTPLYMTFGRYKQDFHSAARRLHGYDGEDTFIFLPFIAQQYGRGMSDSILALLLGAVTHVFTDSQFHPFIYCFSGTCLSQDARAAKNCDSRHLTIETYLALHHRKQVSLFNRGHLSALLKNEDFKKREVLKLLNLLFFGNKSYPQREIKRVLSMHSFLQSAFFKRRYISLVKALNLCPFIHLDKTLALFYPSQRNIRIPFFQQPFSYLHPVTGEEIEESIQDIENRVINQCQEIFLILEEWKLSKYSDTRIKTPRGPSAYTGLYSSKYKTMKHFLIKNVKKLLLTGDFCQDPGS